MRDIGIASSVFVVVDVLVAVVVAVAGLDTIDGVVTRASTNSISYCCRRRCARQRIRTPTATSSAMINAQVAKNAESLVDQE